MEISLTLINLTLIHLHSIMEKKTKNQSTWKNQFILQIIQIDTKDKYIQTQDKQTILETVNNPKSDKYKLELVPVAYYFEPHCNLDTDYSLIRAIDTYYFCDLINLFDILGIYMLIHAQERPMAQEKAERQVERQITSVIEEETGETEESDWQIKRKQYLSDMHFNRIYRAKMLEKYKEALRHNTLIAFLYVLWDISRIEIESVGDVINIATESNNIAYLNFIFGTSEFQHYAFHDDEISTFIKTALKSNNTQAAKIIIKKYKVREPYYIHLLKQACRHKNYEVMQAMRENYGRIKLWCKPCCKDHYEFY